MPVVSAETGTVGAEAVREAGMADGSDGNAAAGKESAKEMETSANETVTEAATEAAVPSGETSTEAAVPSGETLTEAADPSDETSTEMNTPAVKLRRKRLRRRSRCRTQAAVPCLQPVGQQVQGVPYGPGR